MVADAPERGDVLWVDLDPGSGHEQRGRRPALVMSNACYNRTTGLCIVYPITSRIKGRPFEVPIMVDGIGGVVLTEHVRCISWTERAIRTAARAPGNVVQDVAERVKLLVSE